MPRPWSRYSLKKEKEVSENDNNPVVAAKRGEKKTIEKVSENDDPQLQEFLQVMQPRVKSKMWANDTLIGLTADQKATENVSQAIKGGEKSISFPVQSNKSNVITDSQATEKSKNAADDEFMSDMDYFKSRVKKDWSDSESEDDATGNDDDDEEEEEEENDHIGDSNEECDSIIKDSTYSGVGEEEANGEIVDPGNPPSSSKDKQQDVLESGRLFVRNLPYTTTEDELREHFSKFGNVSEVHIVVDKDTKRSKGIAYVLYAIPESASRAIEIVDNSIFQGRLLHVMAARHKKSSDKQELHNSTKTLKQRREEERKASEASGNTKAWNSLFMRPDTVVENIARKHSVSKSDLLDREANDLAVRIALGETQVIAETKKALTNAGVNVSSLEEFSAGKIDGPKRSNHVFLVKNLPYDSSEGELAKMFGKFGSLDKVILPSTKTLALVVFLGPAEAAAAFKGLAYKRYKGVPLYLEWAPSDVLSQSSTSKGNRKNDAVVGEHDAKRALLEQYMEGVTDVDIDPDRVESRSLFVKNLNFKTSDENLRKHFGEHMREGRILSVKVKKHLKNGKNVSMGFGFLEFDSMETATNVCRDLQGTILDGHALILQLCHAKKDEQVVKKAGKDKSSTKLLVRNVAFEATEKDLRHLFSPFGQIKSLRLPMKFGNHRGFAFVEYVTKQEAQNAIEALSNTHLYGRHLVLERAKEGESLEELRARTAAQFTDEVNGFQNLTKLSKKRKHMTILDEGRMKFERIAE